MTVVLFIIILGILVFIHELGHFWAARRSGVAVEEFGFGFPPRIIGWQRGKTLLSLNWIPFGGFVRLQGEQGDEQRRPDSFSSARFSRQLLVMAAGVLMNAVFAWLLMTVVMVAGIKTDGLSIPQDRFIRHTPVQLEAVVTPKSAADVSGLRNGDAVTAVDGQSLTTTQAIIDYVTAAQYPTISVRVERAGQPLTFTVTPKPSSDHPRYGFGVQATTITSYPWYVAPWYGLMATLTLVRQTLVGFGQLIADLVTTAKVSQDVAGPVGIAVLTGQIVQFGFIATLQFMAILSVSLAVVNFLPLPALDGGRALFLLIGKFRGRPLNQKIEGVIHAVGFYGLILVVILLSIRDVSRFDLLQQLRTVFQ